MRYVIKSLYLGFVCFPWVLGCSGAPEIGLSNPYQPYDNGAVVAVDGEKASVIATEQMNCDPNVANCDNIKRTGEYCTAKDQDGAVDIVMNGSDVVATVCYGTAGSHEKNVTADASWGGKLDGNNSLVTFGAGTNGAIFKGGLQVSGNRVTIYGNGPDKTIFEGDSNTSGNNTRVRGVTIKGDLEMSGNNASLVFTVVRGNLSISGNNALLANLVVYGDLQIQGNNHILRRVYVAGKTSLSGKNYICSETRSFVDDNKDHVVEDAELGKSWSCPKK